MWKAAFPLQVFLYVKKYDFIFSKAGRGNKIHHFFMMLPTLLERKKNVFILENKNEVAQFIKKNKQKKPTLKQPF